MKLWDMCAAWMLQVDGDDAVCAYRYKYRQTVICYIGTEVANRLSFCPTPGPGPTHYVRFGIV